MPILGAIPWAYVAIFGAGAAAGGVVGFGAGDGVSGTAKLVKFGVIGAGVYVAGKMVKAW